MIDLSHLAASGPWATSQHGGNQCWLNTAMTGPGTPSGDLPDDQVHAVSVEPIAKPRSVLVDGHDSPSPVPWRTASDDEYLPARMLLARGSWNEV